MTKEIFGGEYNQYRRENSADAFALAMYRRDARGPSQFAQNIMLVRSLWFLDGGPCYRTYESLKTIQAMPRADLKNNSLMELFRLAEKVRNTATSDYRTFVEQQAIALQAAQQIGYKPSDYGENSVALAQRNMDEREVANSANHYLELYKQLFDDTPIEFRPDKNARQERNTQPGAGARG